MDAVPAGGRGPGPEVAQARRLKHERVADELEGAIRDGRLTRGDRLLGEHDLARAFAVSRGTMRRALDELGNRNLITTRTGRGSFVTFDGQDIDDAEGWGRALLSRGVDVVTDVLRLEVVTDPELAIAHGTAGQRFLAVDRVRRLRDGTVICLERSRVPAVGALADVPRDGLLGGSLAASITAAGLHGVSGEQWVQVVPLTAEDAVLMHRDAGTPYLHTVRLTRGADGDLVEKVSSVLDPDRFRLHLSF